MKILLVDDDVFVRAYLSHVLSKQKHEVIECTNGLEALAFANSQKMEMAVVDVMMPEMDGITLVKQLKQKSPNMAVLGISGGEDVYQTGGKFYLDLMLEAGADRVLQKPFDEKEFLTALNEAALRITTTK